MRVLLSLLVIGLLSWSRPAAAAPADVLLAAAADLQQALPALVAAYGHADRVHLETTFGSSGKLFAQIRAGAPYDAFFSADAEYPRLLEHAGLVVPGTRVVYGTGRLVLWSPARGGVDVSKGLAVLGEAAVTHVAIANPAHAPYGRAAEAALRHAGLYERVRPKLVLGENVSQAAQYASTGTAQAALIALSLAGSPVLASGQAWTVPPAWYPALTQEGVVLRRSTHARELAEFMRFVRSKRGQAVLARAGILPR